MRTRTGWGANLLAGGSSGVQDYKGLHYRHEGRLYQDADTLIIHQ